MTALLALPYKTKHANCGLLRYTVVSGSTAAIQFRLFFNHFLTSVALTTQIDNVARLQLSDRIFSTAGKVN